MLSAESSKMSKKIPSQDLNSELNTSIEAYREAARSDAFLFGDYDVYEVYGMPKNELKKDELKNRVLRLKNDVYEEPKTVWQGDRDMAHKYLDKVLNIIDEYRY